MIKAKPLDGSPVAQVVPGQPQDWPLTCICNLCQCGNHRCSNFSWDEERAARLARRLDQQELDLQSESSCVGASCQAHDTCNYYQLNQRYLTRDAKTNGSVRETNRKSGAGDSSAAVADANCRNRPAANETVGNDMKHSCNDEMLHVLVTRPEIAGRPRDNIVFEGDMDLKSTFETSYNALARMRLEHWKRHQEARNAKMEQKHEEEEAAAAADEQQEVSVDRGKRESINRMHAAKATPNLTEGANERAVRRPHHQRQHRSRALDKQTRQRRQVGGGQRWAGEHKVDRDDEQEDDKEFDSFLADGENYLQDTPKRHRTKHMRLDHTDSTAPEDQLNQQATQVSRPGRLVHSPPTSPAKQLVMASPISRVRSPTPIETGGHPEAAQNSRDHSQTPLKHSSSTVQRQQQQQDHVPACQRAAAGVPSRYSIRQQEESSKINDSNVSIDPDLAPIICYDSNMNRLERVGIRKRSKYRPSTSLRPGGRGFFGGETSELDGHVNEQHDRGADHRGLSDDTIGRAQEGVRATSVSPSGAAGATTKELDRGNDTNLSGRRHLLNHMGRVDHIKEAELEIQEQRKFEDKSTLTEALARESLDKQLSEQAEALTLAAADQQVDLERRLAEEEESAAVAEIQRCTREPLESQTQQATPEPQVAVLTNLDNRVTNERSRASSRQSRQQRVCQDQSFNICENEYPDARGAFEDDYCIKIGGRTSSSSRASQREQNSGSPYNLVSARSEKAKNLFRESPDFILTTSTTRRDNAFVQPNNGLSKTSENNPERNMVESRFSHMSAINENDDETSSRGRAAHPIAEGASRVSCSPSCRVLNLDNQYEFVGSKSGHKYFVERDSSIRNPLLISETA